MNILTFEEKLVDGYVRLLRNLDLKSQQNLILRLESELNLKKNKLSEATSNSFGNWVGNESADEIIDSINTSRNFKRDILEF